jgi:hypothetical protein
MAPGDIAFQNIGDLWKEEIQEDLNLDDEAEVESLEGSDSKEDKPEEMKTDDTDPKPAA